MIRVFRWLAIVGCGMGVAGVGICLLNVIDRNFLIGGTGSKLMIVFREITGPMILLMFSALLYVSCEIADRLHPARSQPESD
jgi:hypothetical protein